MSHSELEETVHRHIGKQRQKETGRRADLMWQIKETRGTEKLPGDYPNAFITELEKTPQDWQIDIFEEGIRFKRDFPYESTFYGMRGWDAARVVVNLDVAQAAVAFRIALYDQQADVNIDEGILVENGKVVSFDQEMGGGFLYSSILYSITREQETTKGESGCTIDHLKAEIDKLPSIVKQLSGYSYGRYLASFLKGIEDGSLDVKTMPRVSIGWPLLSPYHAAAREE